MHIQNALAGVAAKDLLKSAAWYEILIGAAGNRPMEEVFEWSLPGGGGLQVFEDQKRAGSSSVTFSVKGIDDYVRRLESCGISVDKRTRSPVVSTAIVRDPDNNQVVIAEQHSSEVIR